MNYACGLWCAVAEFYSLWKQYLSTKIRGNITTTSQIIVLNGNIIYNEYNMCAEWVYSACPAF